MRPKVLGGFKSSPICASSAAMIYSSFAVLYITNDTAAFASVTVGDAFDCVHCFSFSKKPTCHTQKVLSTIIIATLAYNINVFRCLYPNLCTARQWLVRAVDNLAASRYKNLVSVLIGTVRLYCVDGVSFSCLAVAFNDVLINMDYCFHG